MCVLCVLCFALSALPCLALPCLAGGWAGCPPSLRPSLPVAEDKDAILESITAVGAELIIVGAFGDLERVEDRWLAQKYIGGEVKDNWCTFSELIEWSDEARRASRQFEEWFQHKSTTPCPVDSIPFSHRNLPLGITKVSTDRHGAGWCVDGCVGGCKDVAPPCVVFLVHSAALGGEGSGL